MQDVDLSFLSAKRRKASRTGQIVGLGLSVFLLPAIFSISPDELARKWCPANSFYVRVSEIEGWSFGTAVQLGPLCLIFLLVALLTRVDLSAYSGAISPRGPRGRYFIPVVFVLACGTALSVYLYIRSISHYYCLTPHEIVVRTRYSDAPHIYSWDAVNVVHGYCWTNKLTRGAPFLGGSVDLLLKDGTELPINLLAAPGIVSLDYRMVENALRGKTYRYYVNATVTPTSCPPDLFPLLWNWPNDRSGE